MNYYAIPGIRINNGKGRKVSLKNIAAIVCDYFSVSEKEFYGGIRKRHLVETRHYYMHFAKNKYKFTLREIALPLGLHHSTVIHGLQTIQDLQFSDPDCRTTITDLEMFINLHAGPQ